MEPLDTALIRGRRVATIPVLIPVPSTFLPITASAGGGNTTSRMRLGGSASAFSMLRSRLSSTASDGAARGMGLGGSGSTSVSRCTASLDGSSTGAGERGGGDLGRSAW